MEVERYSHVMHISSTVKGKLLPKLDAWDALRAALPAGTISGAPKVRRREMRRESDDFIVALQSSSLMILILRPFRNEFVVWPAVNVLCRRAQ